MNFATVWSYTKVKCTEIYLYVSVVLNEELLKLKNVESVVNLSRNFEVWEKTTFEQKHDQAVHTDTSTYLAIECTAVIILASARCSYWHSTE